MHIPSLPRPWCTSRLDPFTKTSIQQSPPMPSPSQPKIGHGVIIDSSLLASLVAAFGWVSPIQSSHKMPEATCRKPLGLCVPLCGLGHLRVVSPFKMASESLQHCLIKKKKKKGSGSRGMTSGLHTHAKVKLFRCKNGS